MKCPSCGADNPDDNRFCYKCGVDMTAVPEPEHVEEEVPEETPKTGIAEHEEEPEAETGPEPQPKPKKGGKGWIVAVVAVLVVAVVAIAAFAMTNDDGPAPERPLDHIQTPNGTYTYEMVITTDGKDTTTKLQYTVRNGEITSYMIGDHKFTASELEDLKDEMEEQRRYSYRYVEGPYWHNESTDCQTYVITYDGLDVRQVVSRDGMIIYESSRIDGVQTRIMLEGWVEGRLIHEVQFVNEDGTTFRNQTVPHGDSIVLPQPEAREHYTFVAWMQVGTGVFYYADTYYGPVDSDLEFKATWGWETYTITFDANGGSNGYSKKYAYTNNYALPDESLVTRSGYKLLGWSESPDATEATYACGKMMTATEDKTYYAVWEDMTGVTHHVEYYGGIGWPYTIGGQDYQHGKTLMNGNYLVGENGYAFVCWTYNGEDVGSGTPVLSDMTLVGKWHKLSDVTQNGKTVTVSLADKGVQHLIVWGDGSFSYATDSASHTYVEDRVFTRLIVYQEDETTGIEYACQYLIRVGDLPDIRFNLLSSGGNEYTKQFTWYIDGADVDVDWYVNTTYRGHTDSIDVSLDKPGIFWITALYSDGSQLFCLESLNKLFEEP